MNTEFEGVVQWIKKKKAEKGSYRVDYIPFYGREWFAFETFFFL